MIDSTLLNTKVSFELLSRTQETSGGEILSWAAVLAWTNLPAHVAEMTGETTKDQSKSSGIARFRVRVSGKIDAKLGKHRIIWNGRILQLIAQPIDPHNIGHHTIFECVERLPAP